MRFCDKLNAYIEQCRCTAKDIAAEAGISAATLSRYRSGESVPDPSSEAFSGLCSAIAQAALARGASEITTDAVRESFLSCSDLITVDIELLRKNLNTLISVLNLNVSQLCLHTNYDASTVFRIRNGSRQPADPEQFASSVASYVARTVRDEESGSVLAKITGSAVVEMRDSSGRFEKVKRWLLWGESKSEKDSGIFGFLRKLDRFDGSKENKSVFPDEAKAPALPFRLSASRYYYGMQEMMDGELDFLKTTALSKSQKPVVMYSTMPTSETAKDPDFAKKRMHWMTLIPKKGLHLYYIHNIDRSFDGLLSGLEEWIPLYMTGQISPFYLKSTTGGVFHHLLCVSGAAALSGEAIIGHHADGRYYLSKTKEDLAYYQKQADALLACVNPLMEIYREERAPQLEAFLLADLRTSGRRRCILSVPPLYTMEPEFLRSVLKAHAVPQSQAARILAYAEKQRELLGQLLVSELLEDEIPLISQEEFRARPAALSLSGMFCDERIPYTYEEYTEHLRQTEAFQLAHTNYTAEFTSATPFRNLQIVIHEGEWAMISKENAPAIHFVIHYPKLRSAIENFVPPFVEA